MSAAMSTTPTMGPSALLTEPAVSLTTPGASYATRVPHRPTTRSGSLTRAAPLFAGVRSPSNAQLMTFMHSLPRGLSPLPSHATKMIKFVLTQCERERYPFNLVVLTALCLRR